MADQTVLIVDDNAAVRRQLRNELERHGWSVLESSAELDASDLAKQRAPDLIIMNASLSDLQTDVIARTLKLDPITCSIPIVAMTVTDRNQGPPKPWAADTIQSDNSLPVIMAKLQHALAKQRTQKPYVLVVDDEPDFVEILTAFLSEGGFAASGALNGREALEVVHAVQPDAILLDLDMPQVDGWELLARLRENKSLEHIRVVILTGHAQTKADEQRGKAMGASAYLLKPCDFQDVIRAIQVSLKDL